MEQETASLIAAVRDGSDEAFIALAEQYAPLVRKMTAKFTAATGSSVYGGEDFSQELYLVLYNAALRYDLDKGEVSFGLYAKICMNNKLISAIRRAGKEPVNCNIDDLEPEEDGGGEIVEKLIEKEDFDRLHRLIREELSDFEMTVYGLYMLGKNAEEIALSVKHSSKSVNNAIYRIRNKIRKLLK